MKNQNQFSVIEHTFITLADGRKLAARIWMPARNGSAADGDTVDAGYPAVLEYLPYRKRDGTAPRDESTYPVFAAAGIVGVRVDISGNGESDGVFDDEYSKSELADGVEVVNWIAKQTWSNGNVGMMGISWGGFNSLQIAALKPEPLKAVISLSSTVDRYNDDIHYKNGCQLYSNYSWANVMLLYASRPPDPALCDDWKTLWLKRLQTQPWLLDTWLAHQTRDAYWQHGSICENFSGYNVPTMIFGGWADLYHNAPPALLAGVGAVNNPVACKAVNGPWIHKYPHFAWPKPRMDFHAEAIAWWKHWLANDNNEVGSLPAYRAFLSENIRPGGRREFEEGHWVAADQWPMDLPVKTYRLKAAGLLEEGEDSTEDASVTLCSPQDCGIACGEIFSLTPDSELAGDQRIDDGGSLVFNSSVLEEPLRVLGRPRLSIRASIDKPLGNLCARLIDVHPDGTAHRVSWGVINLAHRNGNQSPQAMQPGLPEDIQILLNECGYSFLPGHRVRLSISTAYWPAILPPPFKVTATLALGDQTQLSLPMCETLPQITVPEPANADPLPDYVSHSPGSNRRWVEKDWQSGVTRYSVFTDTGEDEMPGHGLCVRHVRDEHWSICTDDPLSAESAGVNTWWTSRGDWQVRIECSTSMHCDAEYFYTAASVKAWHGEELVNERQWENKIRREFM